MNWANIWRKIRPEPDEARRRLRAKVRLLSAENRRTLSLLKESEAKCRRLTEQVVTVERQIGMNEHGLRERESQIALLEKERETLVLIVKRHQAYEEREAALKLIDIEAAKQRIKGAMRGE